MPLNHNFSLVRNIYSTYDSCKNKNTKKSSEIKVQMRFMNHE